MLLGLILLGIGLFGFGLAGYLDLRYTEFPDWLPYSMIILALLVRGIFSFLENDWWVIGNSIFVGVIFLCLGLAMYLLKQWGDGDAWLLGALGFLFPDTSGFAAKHVLPFPLTLLFNFFLVSLIYLIAYSLFLGWRNREIGKLYLSYLKGQSKILVFLIALFFVVSWGSVFYFYSVFHTPLELTIPMLFLPFLLVFVLLFIFYTKVIEERVFRKRINVRDLKVGDVILDGRWRGLREEEIEEIKSRRKYVWIKEGVRFAPVFLFVMLISIFYGDIIIILI